MKSILIIAAHPDDEVLGCGGTIAKHVRSGDKVHILILSEGATSRSAVRDRDEWNTELSLLAQAADKASKILGVSTTTLENFPDNRMDSCDLLDIVKVIEETIHKMQPEIVYTHHMGDLNIDHQCIHKAVITACRPIPGHSVKFLLFFEVPSSTEWQIPNSAKSFTPNCYVNITNTLDLKMEALYAYQIEMRQWPHPRSLEAIKHLAHWRGASIGVDAAEAFMVGRQIL